MTFQVIKGEFVNFHTNLYAERTEAEKIVEFGIIVKIYMRIMTYKSRLSFSNEVQDLVPLAITETFLSLDSAEEKIYFVVGLLKNYLIEILTEKGGTKIVIKDPQALGMLNHNQIFESLIIAFNFKRGSDFCLKAMLPAINAKFQDYDSLMRQYLELNSDEFEKSVLKLGFCKRKDD